MEEITAIPQFYNGYQFRSKTEARWAYLFDQLEIPYYYEPEPLSLPNGINYWPDFYLPDCNSWFEAKGIMDKKSEEKISGLIKYGDKPVIVGFPDMTFQACNLWETEDENGREIRIFSDTQKEYSALVKCRSCGKYYFMGQVGSWRCLCCGIHEGDHHFIEIVDGELDMLGRFPYIEDIFINAKNAFKNPGKVTG